MERNLVQYIDCYQNKTVYDCLKIGWEYAEAADCHFICSKPKNELFGRNEVEVNQKGDKI